MRNPADLDAEFVLAKREGADGLIIWGASDDVSNPSDCAALTSYVHDTLGPLLHGLIDQAGR